MPASPNSDEFLKDVAARIIQFYARRYLAQRGRGTNGRTRTAACTAADSGSIQPRAARKRALHLSGDTSPAQATYSEHPSRLPCTSRPPRPPTGMTSSRRHTPAYSTAVAVLSPRNRRLLPGIIKDQSAALGTAHEESRLARNGPRAAESAANSPPHVPPLEDSAQHMNECHQIEARQLPITLGHQQRSTQPQEAMNVLTHPARGSTCARPSSPGSKHLSNVLLLLDRLEAQAAEEAAQLAPAAPGKATSLAQVVACQPQSLSTRTALTHSLVQPAMAAPNSALVHRCERVLAQAARAAEAGQRMTPGHEPEAVKEAAAVAAGVRGKIQRLQQQVADKDQEIAALHARADALMTAQHDALTSAAAQHAAQLAAARREHDADLAREVAVARQLAGEKDALSARCSQLAADLAAMQAECAKQIDGLRDGLARELRKQKEAWIAAERAKREEWVAQKERSLRETTVRGLEKEVQKLVATHKAALSEAEQAGEAEAVRRVQAATAQHEEHVARLRAAAAAEVASAVAAEHARMQLKAEEAAQRFEGELCALRLRLAAEHQVALERAEAGRREDRAVSEERVRQAVRDREQHVAALRAEWEEARGAATARHKRELAAAQDEVATGQEAWRAAVSERAARDLEAREVALRRKLTAERDAEIRAVVARLEEENLMREQQLEERTLATEAKAKADVSDEPTRARREGEAVARRAQAAEVRAERLESLLQTLQHEVVTKSAEISRLQAVAAEQLQQAERERERLTKAFSARETELSEVVATAQAQADTAERRVAAAEEQVAGVSAARDREMGELEARISAALASKDATIAALRRQLDDLHSACG